MDYLELMAKDYPFVIGREDESQMFTDESPEADYDWDFESNARQTYMKRSKLFSNLWKEMAKIETSTSSPLINKLRTLESFNQISDDLMRLDDVSNSSNLEYLNKLSNTPVATINDYFIVIKQFNDFLKSLNVKITSVNISIAYFTKFLTHLSKSSPNDNTFRMKTLREELSIFKSESFYGSGSSLYLTQLCTSSLTKVLYGLAFYYLLAHNKSLEKDPEIWSFEEVIEKLLTSIKFRIFLTDRIYHRTTYVEQSTFPFDDYTILVYELMDQLGVEMEHTGSNEDIQKELRKTYLPKVEQLVDNSLTVSCLLAHKSKRSIRFRDLSTFKTKISTGFFDSGEVTGLRIQKINECHGASDFSDVCLLRHENPILCPIFHVALLLLLNIGDFEDLKKLNDRMNEKYPLGHKYNSDAWMDGLLLDYDITNENGYDDVFNQNNEFYKSRKLYSKIYCMGLLSTGSEYLGDKGVDFKEVYDLYGLESSIPKDGATYKSFRVMAGFEKDDPYHVPRAEFEIPKEFSKTLFPWIDEYQWSESNKHIKELLLYCREVILQDYETVIDIFENNFMRYFVPNNEKFEKFLVDIKEYENTHILPTCTRTNVEGVEKTKGYEPAVKSITSNLQSKSNMIKKVFDKYGRNPKYTENELRAIDAKRDSLKLATCAI